MAVAPNAQKDGYIAVWLIYQGEQPVPKGKEAGAVRQVAEALIYCVAASALRVAVIAGGVTGSA